ncbi:helix-turn-helix domain-containing protein [Ferrimonas sediminicola]|uniref:Helix-turn-helix domain-containing protein n=1 Tax=Ferrimonas sediminicola TaxID=2569538 RepID=A0A4U1BGT6_9GAMM|nr:helix-turn-helix domain-containing protein [Ferrimonas sediminicola]TKB49932.1 helix-turn-helix domain-containing protein [Ferrimonas sediminicola]
MTTTINPNPLLNEQQAADYLDLQPNTLAVWRCRGRNDLPYCKIGRNVRYRKSDLDDFLNRATRCFVEQSNFNSMGCEV